MRLTFFSKFLIFLVILGGLFFGAKTILGDKLNDFLPEELRTEKVLNTSSSATKDTPNSNPTLQSKNPNSSTSTNTQEDIKNNRSVTASKSPFNYNPKQPIGGKLMGVVELGASGFNSFIIKKDIDDNWAKQKYEWGNSMVIDGMANENDIIKGLKKYISDILDYGVAGRDIHFVVSSGASKEATTTKIIAALKEIGYIVNVVTPEQEGGYALRSVLPKSFEQKAYVVDMGSSNTKISWLNGRISTAKEAPGSKYFKKGINDSQAYLDVRGAAKSVPQNLTKTCFIIGGVPFNFAKQSRKEDERYTLLEDPKNYEALANKKGKKVQSGLNIYQGIIDGTGTEQFIFDWNANFAIGFLLALPG